MNISTETNNTNGSNFNIQSGTTTINNSIYNYAGWYQGLTKNGTGTLVLNGANSYNGTTNLRAGTLVLNNNTALGAGSLSTLTIISGTLDVTNGSTITLTNNYTQSWNGDFAFLGTNGSLNMGTGAVTMNASRTVTVSNGTLTVGGAIGGSTFGLTKNGSGTLVLSGANTYNGTTTVNNGTLTLGAADRIADTSNLNVAGGTFNLGGFNETLGSITGSGNITLGAGTLTTNSTSNTTFSGLISGTGGLTKNGTSTLTLSGNNTYNGTTTINAGTIEIAAAGRLGAGNYTGNISNSGGLIHSGTTNQILGGILSGSGSLTQNAASTLTLSGANTYNGTTTIKSGTLVIGHATGLGSGGNISFTGGGLQYGSGITTDISSRIKNSTLAILVDTNGNNVTFASALDSTNAGGFTKNGTGILTLGGNNTYAGNTRINAGTVEIGAAGRLGAGNYTGNIVNNGTFIYSGTSNQTLGGIISGSGALTHNASSTLTLTGNNTFNGATAINAGTLVLSGTNTASAITVASGATLMGTGRGGATTVSGTIAPGNSPGTLTVGALTLNGGGVYTWEMADATGVAGTGWDRIASTGLLTVNSTSGSTFTIAITSSGAPSNWTGNSTQSWDIITYGSLSGFDATKFSINATAFAGSTANGSSWTLTDTGSALRLSYSILTDPIWAAGAADWSTGFSPAITNGANATFTGAGGTATNDIVTGSLSSIDSITFNATAGAYTLAANSGSSGYDAASALQLNGNIVNNSTATQTINLALTSSASRVFNAASGNLVLGGPLAGNGGLTKNGSNKLTLSANNTYTGDTTINAGTLEITSTGLLGGGSYSGNIVNTGAFLIGSNSNQTLSGVISGIGALTKNGTGTLTLAGNNNYSGGTMLNTGTLVIGNAAAAGTGTITQANGSSLLKIDTTGTITNDMSVYNVLASQSATLSGAITVNNATWDIDTGDTLTISGAVSGNGGVTKNGGGRLTLNGTNTYNGSTIVNSGTLEAASAGALGNNATVQVTGGSLLVSADNALNNKSLTLNSTSIAGLAFSGNYSGRVNNLTLSQNSIIDLGDGSVSIMFDTFVMNSYTLDIYNWTGTTLWGGGTGNDTDKVYFGPDLSDAALAKIYFHSGAVGGGDSFLGSGFELMPRTTFEGGLGYQIIPVPEPETYATGLLLLLGGAWWMWKRKPKAV
jgi:autotransporter-associated beta strand protein